MKIKSAWRDYYDWVANQYGGGDPSVVFVRDRVASVEDSHMLLEWRKDAERALFVYVPKDRYVMIEGVEYTLERKLLIVAGKPYFAQRTTRDPLQDSWRRKPHEQEAMVQHIERHSRPWSLIDGASYVAKNAEMYGDQAYERLARHLGCASFTVERSVYSDTLRIEGYTPCLNDYGFASVVEAQTMYQELALFVGSLKNEAPDLNMTDVQKVEAHGLDKRWSFRHRK